MRFATPPKSSGNGVMVSASGSAGVPMGQPVQRTFKGPNIKNATEIPNTPPDVQGIYRKRQDNSVFIGTGNVMLSMPPMNASGGSAGGEMTATNDGPEVEVVVTRKTQIFKDTTSITMAAIESGKEIQQTIELVDSLDALVEVLGKADSLSVWGTRNGDRYVATLILYRPPVLISASG